MEGGVRGMLELRLCEAFMIIHYSVADKLDLWYTRNGPEMRMQNGLLGLLCLIVTVPIILATGVESLVK